MASTQMPPKKAPARQTRRYIAPPTVLERYGATVLLSSNDPQGAAEPTGISISGVNIVTRASPSIGSEHQMDALTQCLEDASNHPPNNNSTTTPKRRRRVCAPEIVFCDSILSVQYCTHNTNQHRPSPRAGDEEPNNNKEVVKITAEDALLEWAKAHQDLQQQDDDGNSNDNEGSSSSAPAYTGVSVLKTADAQLWSQRHAASSSSTSSSSFSNPKAGCDFYYDWTFSTPFMGGGGNHQNASWKSSGGGGNDWVETKQSGIDMGLLQDSSQPILYFDELVFYEDDLHDNGDVSLTVKVRVMPTCWFVLQRLYVRVDHVLVRLREVRFFATLPSPSSQITPTTTTVHRTVTWKECAWDDLLQHDLPADVSLWRAPPAYPPPSPQQLQTLERFFQRLPTVSQLPKGIPLHSSLALHNDDDG